jgi:ketosteroid isomerase-like protein
VVSVALARRLLGRFNANDVAGVLDAMTDDVTWRLPGKPGALPVAGVQNKEQIGRVFENMAGRLKNGLAMTVKGMIAEGDRVAIERDGKVSEVREYLDTQHVFATWFMP